MPKNNQQQGAANINTANDSWDLKKFYKIAGVSFVAILLFLSGWAIGNGRITLSSVKNLNNNVSSAPDYSEVTEAYNLLRTKYDGTLTEEQLVNGMMSGLAQSTGDPYTEFFSGKEATEFNEQLSGKIIGIGAQLGKSDDGYIEVIAPISGSPAEKAGIRSKDIIAAVNGDSTAGWQVDKAVSKIRGDKGTTVELTVIRGEAQEPLKISIVRDEITVPSVESEILPGNIGYMKINQFSENTASLSKEAAKKFTDAKVDKIILDVRDNPGGYVDQAVDVASLWLPKNKLILQEKRGGKVISSEYSTGVNPLQGIDTVVLINGGSASASEIVAGALKDNSAAAIVGEKSYGKGSVQEPINLDNGALLKVTIAKWYRPNGKNINKVGITPDKTVEMTQEDYTANRDPQKDAAITELTQ